MYILFACNSLKSQCVFLHWCGFLCQQERSVENEIEIISLILKNIYEYLVRKNILYSCFSFSFTDQNEFSIVEFIYPCRRLRPLDPVGSCRKATYIAGSGSSIPTGNFSDFLQWIPVNFPCFPAGTGRKSSEKIRKFSGGNTASMFQRFPMLSCRNGPVIFDLGHLII
jgi:hypothetical protein